ncbi:hypothetical protein ACP70R_045147 [Stipagrostis hirtigluma subsp. patula]
MVNMFAVKAAAAVSGAVGIYYCSAAAGTAAAAAAAAGTAAATEAAMNAPGAAGFVISHAAFLANPQLYFHLLRTVGPKGTAAAFAL